MPLIDDRTASDPGPTGTIPLIQVLRGLAALAVTFLHITQQAGVLVGRPGEPAYPWLRPLPWDAGVDVFFVISGFVMVWSSVRLFAAPGGVRRFLARRAARVVPLYWLLTSALVAVAAIRPGALSEGLGGGPAYVAASYAFLPWRRDDGLIQPAFRLGWTLNYEMLFYALFALFLFLPARRAIPCVCAAILALAAAGRVLRPEAAAAAFWSDPIVLEFAFGVLLATARLGGASLPAAARAACVVAALALLAFVDARAPFLPRGIGFGVPAALLMAAAVLARPRRAGPLGRPWVLLGDASYALYLVHPFPMRALVLVWPRAGPVSVLGFIVLATALSVAAAFALHRCVERPATAWARRALRA